MPSIEIACIDLDSPVPPPPTSFAIEFERGLRSHRSPAPRFQADFDALAGCLYHVGNPAFAGRGDGPFFAYEVLSEASRHCDPRSFLEFDAVHLPSARSLLAWLVDQSPSGRLLFTSDWQFGPDGTVRAPPLDLAAFWALHDSRELSLNAAYPIVREA